MANFFSKMPPYMKELTLNIAAFIWLLFVLTNANTNLGNAYLWFLGIATGLLFLNILIFNKNVQVTYQKSKGGTLEAFFAGAIGWVILLVISLIVLKVIDPAVASFGAIAASLGAANPAFSNSVVVNWITISFAIGYAETILWARLLEFLSDRFGFQINRANIKRTVLLVIVFLLSILFLIFHLTSKGVAAVSSLAIVFIMMAISLLMVVYYNGETRQAVWLHIIANGAAGALLLASGGLMFG